MENTEIQTQDIDNMVDEVSNVLRTHLINIIKNIKDDSVTLKILSQLPIVKNLQLENIMLRKTIIEYKSEIAVLRNDLSSKNTHQIPPHLSLNVSEMNVEGTNDVKQIILNDNPFLLGCEDEEEEECVNKQHNVIDDMNNDHGGEEAESEAESESEEEEEEEAEEEADEVVEEAEEEAEEEADEVVEEAAEEAEEEADEVVEEAEEEADEAVEVNSAENDRDKEIETEEDQVDDEEDEEDEEDDLEVEEWEHKGIAYYITDKTDGPIFECLEDEEIGEEIGYFKKGKVFFS